MIGILALLFVLLSFIQKNNFIIKPSKTKGYLWFTIAGYTSFLIHAGSPPANIFLLPQKLDKTIYVGTMTLAFFIINMIMKFNYLLYIIKLDPIPHIHQISEVH